MIRSCARSRRAGTYRVRLWLRGRRCGCCAVVWQLDAGDRDVCRPSSGRRPTFQHSSSWLSSAWTLVSTGRSVQRRHSSPTRTSISAQGAEARVIAEDLLEHDPDCEAHAQRVRRAIELLGAPERNSTSLACADVTVVLMSRTLTRVESTERSRRPMTRRSI